MAQFPSTTSAYGRWGLLDIRDAIMGGNWPSPPVGDPYFNYTTMLLHGDGTPGVLPFNSDASANNFNIAINGDTKPNPFNPYQAGYYGNYFDGVSDYLSIGASSAFAFGSGDFTVECWINSTELTSDTFYRRVYMTDGPTGNASGNFQIAIAPTTGYVNAWDGGSLDLLGTSNVCNGAWNHIAVTRSGTTLRIFVNGVQQASTTYSVSVSPNSGTPRPYIGSYNGSQGDFNGYISNLRVVKGTAVYTSNFTPSTTPLTAITNTSLLTCQSNRFIDNSTNNFTITRNGDVAVTYFQPFTLPSSVEDYGAGYFDGNGDYLSVADNAALILGTGDFTIECWVYPLAVNGSNANPLINKLNGGSNTGWLLGMSSTSLWQFSTGSSVIVRAGAVSLNTWTHLAAVRSSGTTTLYVNGTSVGSTATAFNFTDTVPLQFAWESSFVYCNAYISNARIVKGTAVYTTAFTPPSAPLTAIANTQLLTLQTNGGANDNGFIDSSPNNFLITRNGNTTQGSFSPYGANWSNYFDGTGDYLSVSNATAFNLSTGDWTIECWINLSALVNERRIWSLGTYGANPEVALLIAGGGAGGSVNDLQINYLGNATLISATSVNAVGAWAHVAFVRASGTSTLYVNGVSKGTTATNPWTSSSTSFWIGGWSQNNNQVNGYISNMRVVKGTAVYTSNFTPSTAPLTAIAGTSLLTCQSNRFKDASANNFTITVNGDTSVQRFSPFGASTAYSAATIGGSGYFDGTGDYLSSNTWSIGTANFTVEAWAYITNTGTSVFGVGDIAGSSGFAVYRNSSGFWVMVTSGTAQISSSGTSSVIKNQWNHVALVRSSGSTKLYINGVALPTTYADTNSYSGAMYIGANMYSGGIATDYTGYISDARFVNSAVYTTNFTPPAAPLTAIANTQLLLPMTNAGIYDNAEMANLETVGNAQVSTTQKKFGAGSMYFDGTGDWLAGPPTPQTDLGSGNFTIECWLYRTASGAGSDSGIVSRGAPGSLNGFVFAYTSSNVLTFNFNYSGAIVTGSTAIPINTWTHVAVTRSGTTFRLFVNGTVDATNTSSNSQTLNAGDIFYVGRSGYDSSRIVTGYIDDLRITKGYARYTANFTPPTEAFPSYWELFKPGAPTGVSATAGNAQATVSFTAPTNNGGAPITSYTVTSSPGNFTATGASSPLTVTGLTNGTSYTFTVTATNSVGTGQASAASNSVTPVSYSGPTTVEYLVVAGGGGAGGVSGDASGGGGAGGYRTAVGYAVSAGSPITVTVGGGGNGGAGGGANDGTQGSSSVFGTITSAGGGYGGGGASGGTVQRNGGSGGSGGGGSNSPATGGAGNTPSTSPSQGNNGGNYYAGGGGAGGAGSATAFNGANNGGIGVTSSISGASVNYAGGGCGGGSQGNAYGGGNGEYNVGAGNNTAGTANTGGGGGGCWNSGTRAGANGGSGVVIIRYADTYAAASATTGSPTITVTGGYRIYKWTGSGSITF